MPEDAAKKPSRIQLRNRKKIMEAALNVFSQHGYRGATLDQIAEAAGMSKPNLIYYFDGKEAIHVAVLNRLMEDWLAPLHEMDPNGNPLDEILTYARRKMEMSRKFPKESRLFANEILQGAPRMAPHLETGLKPLFEEKAALIGRWIGQGRLAMVNPEQLILSIWAITQHYADFDAQIRVLIPDEATGWDEAFIHVEEMFRKLLSVSERSD
ncbi:TetR family transcriptional regulator [Salipiger aestuarii]|uniref:TetR family transcriptional regulator n=1 Tax=Salipiger aestuarii TaxID=568098 RepID=A0A327Y5U0_9RHOB|nr:TetR family transcriptional regulator C-terminal domain-containing protein [Salipiger aestuarii]EIE49768.1 TetR family transcriptional regulator [Citreicella sp. 357]KAA8607630.1 TetR family transcriptional regulator [Salipiger aestuarii]KAA8611091.1 TetR family transcriptional regulator [Salipiger aestuarii]KAB2541858.1 TetR family transcriptional regulator [Salipiger aestuarii]RAK15376.1 TetR family transcriptional regulator [Salipiger aestuarii]